MLQVRIVDNCIYLLKQDILRKLIIPCPPSSGLSRSVTWFDTDVSGLPTGPIVKGQAVSKTSRLIMPSFVRNASVSNDTNY